MNKLEKKTYVKKLKGFYDKIEKSSKIILEGEGVDLFKKCLKTEIQTNWIDTLERKV